MREKLPKRSCRTDRKMLSARGGGRCAASGRGRRAAVVAGQTQSIWMSRRTVILQLPESRGSLCRSYCTTRESGIPSTARLARINPASSPA